MDAAGRRVPVIAKLEKAEAIDHLTRIVDAFDGVMVARGDPRGRDADGRVPIVQKRAVMLARERAKPAIVATQMLESMRVHSRPTRAEVSDVANAVLDGADALMLSAETSVGEHARRRSPRWPGSSLLQRRGPTSRRSRPANATPEEAIAQRHPSSLVGQRNGASSPSPDGGHGPVALRRSGRRCPSLAFTPVAAVRSRLTLTWGVETFVAPLSGHLDDMVVPGRRHRPRLRSHPVGRHRRHRGREPPGPQRRHRT